MFKEAACNGFGGKWMRNCLRLNELLMSDQRIFPKKCVFRRLSHYQDISWMASMKFQESLQRPEVHSATFTLPGGFGGLWRGLRYEMHTLTKCANLISKKGPGKLRLVEFCFC